MNVITGWPRWQGNRRRHPDPRRGRIRIVTALLLAAATGPAGAAASAADSFLWPLETEPRAITGTFMEARSAHYHSGLDVKTQGRIGLRLLAPADGWVSRVRVSPEGYGKAIYLRLADGSTLVFAHLSALADPLQERITQAQARSGRYEQDLRLEAGEIAMDRGDLLGLTGATGTGAPHLHLEVRTPDGRPANPLLRGFSVPDEKAPLLRRFRLLPADASTRIAGRAQALVVGREETVDAVGPLRVQVDVVDKTGVYDHSLMPLGLELTLDGEPVYSAEQSTFDFAQGRQMRLEMDRGAGARRPWFAMYQREGNDLPARSVTENGFTCRVPRDGQRHRLVLRGWDAAGNVDSVGIWIRGEAPAVVPKAARPSASSLGPGKPAAPWSLEITLGEAVAEILAKPPAGQTVSELTGLGFQVVVPGAEHPLPLTMSRLEDGTGVCAAIEMSRLATGVHGFYLIRSPGGTVRPLLLAEAERHLVIGGSSIDERELADGGLVLDDPTGKALFPGGALWVEPGPGQLSPPRGTSVAGPAWSVRGSGVAFRGDLGVTLPAAWPPGEPVGLFVQDVRGRWSWLGAEVVHRPDGEGRAVSLRGELSRLGTVVALRDPHPPFLGEFGIGGKVLTGERPVLSPVEQRNYRGVTLPRWPVISLPIMDAGAGLDAEGVVCELDGAKYPARWDPEEERIYFELHVDPGAGPHRIRVEATDRLGNTAEKSQEFELREL
jgi:hypothetical protein